MLKLVGETQSAFVCGEEIQDGALVAKEVVWWIKKSNSKAILMKLDFQKVYDSLRVFLTQSLSLWVLELNSRDGFYSVLLWYPCLL